MKLCNKDLSWFTKKCLLVKYQAFSGAETDQDQLIQFCCKLHTWVTAKDTVRSTRNQKDQLGTQQ